MTPVRKMPRKETEDDTAKQLASYSFKQSYTKTHCYKLLDLMN